MKLTEKWQFDNREIIDRSLNGLNISLSREEDSVLNWICSYDKHTVSAIASILDKAAKQISIPTEDGEAQC